MAFGKIVSESGNGRYFVTIPIDNSTSDNLKNRLEFKKQYVEQNITVAEGELADLEQELYILEGDLFFVLAAIDNIIEGIEANIVLYTAALTVLNAELQALKEELKALEAEKPPNGILIDSAKEDIIAKEAEIKAKKDQLSAAESSKKAKEDERVAEEKKVADKRLEIVQKTDQIVFMEVEVLSLTKKITQLDALGFPNTGGVREAWCVDLSEGLGGTVKLLEVMTDIDEHINIFPGYEGKNYGPTIAEQGTVQPFYSLPVADAMRNFLMYPAIQKWKPSFRYGQMGPVNYEANTATVYLDYNTSRIQSLGVNQAETLYNVPIEYMQCKAGAFEEGDKVVVQFEFNDWLLPKVIGFQSFPKPCGWEEPWDGPLYTTRYNWNYNYGFVGGTGTQATYVITDGVLAVDYPPTDEGSGSLEQFHHIQFVPADFNVTQNVSRIKFDANADTNCLETLSSSSQDAYLVVAGWNEAHTHIVSYLVYVLKNKYYSGVGCIDYPGYAEFETDWIKTNEGTTDIWWYPGGPFPYKIYQRQIFGDKDEFMAVPEVLSTVLGVGVESHSAWGGGLVGNEPDQIDGVSFTVNMIALA